MRELGPTSMHLPIHFTSLPRALDMGGESHYIDTRNVQRVIKWPLIQAAQIQEAAQMRVQLTG
jgi:hypothetical protein